LRVAAQLCDRIIVMRRGEVVETGPTGEVFAYPSHAYTRQLLSSIPGRDWTPPDLRTDAA
jgi:peptide/nickel transport system ATP-binding protein